MVGNPVVVVQRDGGQGGYINLVFAGGGNLWCQFRVQGMDSFQDEDGMLVDAQLVSLVLFLPEVEVEAGAAPLLRPGAMLVIGC